MDKDIVKLRKKPLKNGGYSLYLDYYKERTRTYEFLKLYLLPGKDRRTKEMNASALEAAETIRAKRIVEIQSGMAGLKKARMKFGEYGYRIVAEKQETTAPIVRRAVDKFLDYMGGDFYLDSVSRENVSGLARWLTSDKGAGLSSSTAATTIGWLSSIFATAIKDGYVQSNPMKLIAKKDRPKLRCKPREYLTIDEVSRISAITCKGTREIVRRAFLFSCFTGLRVSDIMSLKWSEIVDGMIVKTQQKTSDLIRVPLSRNALALLPERSSGPVFPVGKQGNLRFSVSKIMEQAGIDKHITFHCARHTFATLELTYGADIYTVSKLLGHKSLQMTQVYTKIIDHKKVEAVNLIPEI